MKHKTFESWMEDSKRYTLPDDEFITYVRKFGSLLVNLNKIEKHIDFMKSSYRIDRQPTLNVLMTREGLGTLYNNPFTTDSINNLSDDEILKLFSKDVHMKHNRYSIEKLIAQLNFHKENIEDFKSKYVVRWYKDAIYTKDGYNVTEKDDVISKIKNDYTENLSDTFEMYMNTDGNLIVNFTEI